MFRTQSGSGWGAFVVAFASWFGTPAASARQVGPPDYGIEFVTIGAIGNAAYQPVNPPAPFAVGRGQVNYEYRIGRTEITTSQWMQFVNTFSTQGVQWRLFAAPNFWGAVPDPGYQGPGRQWMLLPNAPDAGMRPCFGLTWREAAMYCNWLQNGQSADPAALQNGVYDASTFTDNPDGTYNDQRTHDPAARFWIPTFDEWLKAAHYDPDRYGPGEGGYWLYDTSSDTAPIPGPPGVGQTSAGYQIPPFGHYNIPLGSYPGTLSPWGLLDTSGGAQEWTEETFEEIYADRRIRWADGSYAGYSEPQPDQILWGATYTPNDQSVVGLRIASSVPSPSAGVFLLARCFLWRKRSHS